MLFHYLTAANKGTVVSVKTFRHKDILYDVYTHTHRLFGFIPLKWRVVKSFRVGV